MCICGGECLSCVHGILCVGVRVSFSRDYAPCVRGVSALLCGVGCGLLCWLAAALLLGGWVGGVWLCCVCGCLSLAEFRRDQGPRKQPKARGDVLVCYSVPSPVLVVPSPVPIAQQAAKTATTQAAKPDNIVVIYISPALLQVLLLQVLLQVPVPVQVQVLPSGQVQVLLQQVPALGQVVVVSGQVVVVSVVTSGGWVGGGGVGGWLWGEGR